MDVREVLVNVRTREARSLGVSYSAAVNGSARGVEDEGSGGNRMDLWGGAVKRLMGDPVWLLATLPLPCVLETKVRKLDRDGRKQESVGAQVRVQGGRWKGSTVDCVAQGSAAGAGRTQRCKP